MFHPSADSTRLPGQMGQMKTQTKDDQLELWTCVTSALSGCVNNPQNGMKYSVLDEHGCLFVNLTQDYVLFSWHG